MTMRRNFLDSVFDVLEFTPTQKEKARIDLDYLMKASILRNLEAGRKNNEEFQSGNFAVLPERSGEKNLVALIQTEYTPEQIQSVALTVAGNVLAAYIRTMCHGATLVQRNKLLKIVESLKE